MGNYEKSISDLVKDLKSNPETGLKSGDIQNIQQLHGKNQFEEQKPESIGMKILHNLKDLTTIILLIAAALSIVLGVMKDEGLLEFFVIMAIVILNMFLAITQERSAEKSLAALKELNSPTSIVLRDGQQQKIDSVDLVPGDIIILKTGDMVSADARLLESVDFTVDEASLTGESLPSEKNANSVLSGKVAVADQENMVFAGCLVTTGRAKAIVCETGMNTQMGHIAKFLNNSQKLKTPLQIRIGKIGKTVSAIAIVSAVIMIGMGMLRGENILDMVLVAISLAVAAVPETLQLIVTLTLAHGVTEMVKKNALIRKLPAVEALGCTSVICTDKTGTLTQNKMKIKKLWYEGGDSYEDSTDFTDKQMSLLHKFALATNAVAEIQSDGTYKVIGSPTEAAIISLLVDKGVDKSEIEKKYPKVAEISFSSARKMVTTVHEDPDGGYLVITSGAYDKIPFTVPDNENADRDIEKRDNMLETFAGDALRILAVGSKHIDKLPDEDGLPNVEKDLNFEGIIGIIDPPREEVAEAISVAKNAGIRTVMITGDHAVTAAAIARQIGLIADGGKVLTGIELEEMNDDDLVENVCQYSVYARVSPEDKIRIVEAWQEHNEVVSMTGDGVNDAPALKAADVGVAMGITGTEVAKSASDMVLTDDNYSTIVESVRQGRTVFANIRKTVYFLLSVNFSEIIIMLGAAFIGWGLPMTPIMLLMINVVGDGIPGMALSLEKAEPRIMQRGPIGRTESLFSGIQFLVSKQVVSFVLVGWVAFYVGTFVPLYENYPPSLILGQTMTFLTVGWSSILHVLNVRSRYSIFSRKVDPNPRLFISVISMIMLFAIIALVPPLHHIFGVVSMGLRHWYLVIALSIFPTIPAEIGKLFNNSLEKRAYKKRIVKHNFFDCGE